MVYQNKPGKSAEEQENYRVKKIITDQRSKQDAFAPRDLTLLYLSNCELTRVPVLKDFRFLRRLWINNNRIRVIPRGALSCCVALEELHAENNSIGEIERGALSSLRSLQVLTLDRNELRDFNSLLIELRPLSRLEVLEIHGNPLAREKDLRLRLIAVATNLYLIDNVEVSDEERKELRERTSTLPGNVGFGTHLPDELPLTYPGARAQLVSPRFGNNYLRSRDSTRMSNEAEALPAAAKASQQSPGTGSNASPWSLGSSDPGASGAAGQQLQPAGAASNTAAAAGPLGAARRPRLSWSARLQRASLERRARKMSAQYSFLDWYTVAELHERSRAKRLQASHASLPSASATQNPKSTHPIAPSRALRQVSLRPLASVHQEPLPSIITVNFKA